MTTHAPPNKIALTDHHGTETNMDGFGRTINTITGYGTNNITITLCLPRWTPNTFPAAAPP